MLALKQRTALYILVLGVTVQILSAWIPDRLLNVLVVAACMSLAARDHSSQNVTNERVQILRENGQLCQTIHRMSEGHQLLCEIRNTLATQRRHSGESLLVLNEICLQLQGQDAPGDFDPERARHSLRRLSKSDSAVRNKSTG
jgi:hypothetical protein